MESIIIDMAIGTPETESWKLSFCPDVFLLEVFLKIGMSFGVIEGANGFGWENARLGPVNDQGPIMTDSICSMSKSL